MTWPIPLLDLVFLWIDRPQTPANVGVVLLLDPDPGVAATTAARRIVRSYRAARPTPPFDRVPELPSLGLPHWRTVSGFEPRQHVRHLRLGGKATLAELCDQVSELHRARLDRSRPLFEVYVIEGLASGQLAVYLKTHHATWDGRYALDRVFGNLDRVPGEIGAPFFAVPPQRVADQTAAPALAGLAGGARLLLTQAAAVRELFARLSARAAAPGSTADLAGNRPFAGPHTRFNEAVGSGRTFASFSVPLERLRQVAERAHATVNDVALAVVDGGVERYLADLGERPRQALVAMCPVSQRSPGDHEATTKVATMFVPLATPRAGAARRLAQISDHTRAAKAELKELSREAALDYALLAFGLWFAAHALGLRAVTRPVINLVVSNVGAVDGPRYLGGHRIAGAYPVSMLADPTGLNVTLLSIDGRMDFGIVADSTAVPDAPRLAEACLATFRSLQRSGRARPLRRGRTAVPRTTSVKT